MTNKAASLLRYAKLDGLGWRRGSLATHRNGKHNPAAMIYTGVEHIIPANSHYQIRHYQGNKTVFTPAGSDYETASALLAKYDASRTLEASQKALGIYVPEQTDAPKTLTEQLAAYLAKKKSSLLKLSKASIHVYETTLTAFVRHCGRKYAAEVTEANILSYLEHLKAEGYAPKVRLKQTDGSTIVADGPRHGYSAHRLRLHAGLSRLGRKKLSRRFDESTHQARRSGPRIPANLKGSFGPLERMRMRITSDACC
jgi:hypothetical protein